jgi:predicted ATPase
MLTKIEIDGFKSFADFSLDIPPFLAIVGPNASGKSNLFDAIQLLRRLAGSSLFDAMTAARGEMGELFRRKGDGSSVGEMRLAAEVLLEPRVADQFGSSVEVTHTRFRYEITLTEREDRDGLLRPYVTSESATPILARDDDWAKAASKTFKNVHLRYKRTASLLETTGPGSSHAIFRIAQDARQGRKRELPANAAEATVLSSITAASEFPLLYALRRELESWRFLQLDPAALRQPSTLQQRADQLETNGANLGRVLRRIEQRTQDETGSGLDEISAALAGIVKGTKAIEVSENAARDEWEVYVSTRDEGRISARVASDGTLRLLALLAALYDPDFRGLICFEEPENGIFPQRLRGLVDHLRDLVTRPQDNLVAEPQDASSESSSVDPLVQLMVSSHSPLLLFAVPAAELVVFDWVSRVDGQSGVVSRITRARRLREPVLQEPLPLDEVGSYLSAAEKRAFPAIGRDEAKQLLDV